MRTVGIGPVRVVALSKMFGVSQSVAEEFRPVSASRAESSTSSGLPWNFMLGVRSVCVRHSDPPFLDAKAPPGFLPRRGFEATLPQGVGRGVGREQHKSVRVVGLCQVDGMAPGTQPVCGEAGVGRPRTVEGRPTTGAALTVGGCPAGQRRSHSRIRRPAWSPRRSCRSGLSGRAGPRRSWGRWNPWCHRHPRPWWPC